MELHLEKNWLKKSRCLEMGFNFEFSFTLADGGSIAFASFASSQLSNGF